VTFEVAGSIWRWWETDGDVDVDIVSASLRPAAVVEAFVALPLVREVLARGLNRASDLTRDGLQVDLRAVLPPAYGATLKYFTGSRAHTIAPRELAVDRVWRLSDYGVFDRAGRTLGDRCRGSCRRARRGSSAARALVATAR
jgi:DNA polymerase (family 10)